METIEFAPVYVEIPKSKWNNKYCPYCKKIFIEEEIDNKIALSNIYHIKDDYLVHKDCVKNLN